MGLLQVVLFSVARGELNAGGHSVTTSLYCTAIANPDRAGSDIVAFGKYRFRNWTNPNNQPTAPIPEPNVQPEPRTSLGLTDSELSIGTVTVLY